MKIILSALGGSLAFCLVLLLPSCKSESVDLRFRLGKGAKYTTRSTTKITTTLQWLNKPASMSSEMQTEGSFEVIDTGGGAKRLQLHFTDLDLSLTAPQGSFTYKAGDSATAPNGNKTILLLLNRPAGFVADDSGRVLSAGSLSGALAADAGTEPDVTAILQQSFNDTALRNRLQQEMVAYPGHAVAPGDAWQRETQMNLNGIKITSAATYQLLSAKDGIARIEVKGKLSMENGGPILANAPASLSGQLSGTQEVEISSGLLLKGEYHLELKGTASQMGASEPVGVSADVAVGSKRQ